VTNPVELNYCRKKKLTLEQSDKWEQMDKCFREQVHKQHANVVNLMELYEMHKENPMNLDSNERIMFKLLQNKSTMFRETFHQHQCEACFTKFHTRGLLVKHLYKFHDSTNIGKLNPYSWIPDDCLLGCHFTQTDHRALHMHLILDHSFDELRDWQIHREYLKLIENLISVKLFFKRCKMKL